MITLAGGTGLVGKTLTQALVRDGEQVRVLTRDPEAAATAFGDAKLEIVGVDFDDPATLRSGFTGSDKAYLSYSTTDRQVRDEIALIDAAIGADVPYLVNLSVGGAAGSHPANVVRWHTEIDAYLAGTGVASTVVRPTTFIDTMLKIASNFVRAGAWGGLGGAGRVALIDTRDVAAVFAVILTDDPQRHSLLLQAAQVDGVLLQRLEAPRRRGCARAWRPPAPNSWSEPSSDTGDTKIVRLQDICRDDFGIPL